MDLGLKLRELRKAKGLTQKEAVRLSGIKEWSNDKSISQIECGRRVASLKVSHLQKLLVVYGVTEAEFFSPEMEVVLSAGTCESYLQKKRFEQGRHDAMHHRSMKDPHSSHYVEGYKSESQKRRTHQAAANI